MPPRAFPRNSRSRTLASRFNLLGFSSPAFNAAHATANPAAARQAIRDRLITAFLASPLPAKYQQTFKQFLYEDDALVSQLTETIFQQINQSIRNGLSEQFAGARDGIFAAMKGPGLMSGAFASAQIRGAPTFNGDAMPVLVRASEKPAR